MSDARPYSPAARGAVFARQARVAIEQAPLLPMKLVLGYLGTTFLLFLVWPINWPLYFREQWLLLSGYVLTALSLIAFGFALGCRGAVARAAALPIGVLITIGSLIALGLLIPSSIIYTGRPPWEVLDALGEQGEAYRRFQQQLMLEGDRSLFALVRGVLAPIAFASVPFGILWWPRLGWTLRTLVIGSALSSLIFGIMRGTDRETAEVFILGGSAFLVVWGRSAEARRSIAATFKRYWKVGAVVALFIAVGASLFTERKADRLAGIDIVCANDSRVCADLDTPALRWMNDRAAFSASIFILSSCSGYYGLALGMEKDFRPTYGFGHSAYAMRVYELLTGDLTFKERTYTYRNTFDGWPPENYWSTAWLFFANDVHFLGALVVTALLAFYWGRAWRAATLGRNDAAAVVFCALMQLFVQFASSSSILNALEGYTTLGLWTIVWLRLNASGQSVGRVPLR